MTKEQAAETWAAEWLQGVADGTLTMSQRKLASVLRHGGIDALRTAATDLGVHLALIVDDRGDELVVASRHPITVIC